MTGSVASRRPNHDRIFAPCRSYGTMLTTNGIAPCWFLPPHDMVGGCAPGLARFLGSKGPRRWGPRYDGAHSAPGGPRAAEPKLLLPISSSTNAGLD
jgi:hypothetical protein